MSFCDLVCMHSVSVCMYVCVLVDIDYAHKGASCKDLVFNRLSGLFLLETTYKIAPTDI